MRALVLAVALLLPPLATAQVSVTDPVYHGVLTVNPAAAKIDLDSLNGMIKAFRWRFDINPLTNGIFPTQEPMLLSVGEENFRLAAGQVQSRNDRVYSYAARPAPERGIRKLRLRRLPDGGWELRFIVQGVDLSEMALTDPVCRPLALIIGDDDFFNGVQLTRKSVSARRIRIPGDCDVGGSWPWIR